MNSANVPLALQLGGLLPRRLTWTTPAPKGPDRPLCQGALGLLWKLPAHPVCSLGHRTRLRWHEFTAM